MSQSDHPSMPPDSPKSQKPPSNPWVETTKAVAVGLLLAVGIRSFVMKVFHIPSSSMEPTLQINDRLVVERVSYRFNTPQRGDIVVFKAPPKAVEVCGLPAKETTDFIKRVIGLPHDRITIRNERVYVNDQPLQESYVAQPPNYNLLEFTVPGNTVLVLGDNRNISCDGHMWGALPTENIVGRAVWRIWPFDRWGSL